MNQNITSVNSSASERKTKFGRPPKDLSEARVNTLKLSVKNSDYDLLQKKAEASGYTQLARFVYDFLFDSLNGVGRNIISVPAVNLDAVNQLTGACRNLNQLTRHFNSDDDEQKKNWKEVGIQVKDLAFLCGLVSASLQGRNEEVKEILNLSSTQKLVFGPIEVVLNGPPSINRDLAITIQSVVDNFQARLSKRPAHISLKMNEGIRLELEQIKGLMVGLTYVLLGNSETGIALIRDAYNSTSERNHGDA